jgi:ABC-type transport system involved in Fe-S cluster assembly fused permease/ATPase subunit
MADETTGVRITQNMIYQELRQVKDTQIQMLEKLDNLADVPDRIREVELTLARLAWIEKIAYTGLAAGITGLLSALFSMLVA